MLIVISVFIATRLNQRFGWFFYSYLP